MSIQLQRPVQLVSLVKTSVKTEPLTVIKNEPPEEALEKEISPDIKEIDIVYQSLSEDSIKSEAVPENIFETKYSEFEFVDTQVLVKAENSSFIKTENITQRNKTEDTSDENVTRGTGQEMIEVQGSHEHYNTLSNLETHKQLILNSSKDLNGIGTRVRKAKHPEEREFTAIQCQVLEHHIENTHKKQRKRHDCDKCDYKTYKSASLKRHNLVHLKPEEIDYFYCYHCSYKFKQKDNLRKHIVRHFKKVKTDEQVVLTFSSDLNDISKSSKIAKYARNTDFTQCYKIDGTTSREKETIEVIRAPTIPVESNEYTSLTEDKHVCNHCQHACKKLNALKYHIRKVHKQVTTMYQCPYCPFKSKWRSTLPLHIVRKHKDWKDVQGFQCHLCEKKFKLKYRLTEHMKVHLKPKQIQDGLDLREKRAERKQGGWVMVAKNEFVSFSRCYNCQGFDHESNECTKNEVCVNCAGNHRTLGCELQKRCINCKIANEKYGLRLNTGHIAFDPECPSLKYHIGLLNTKTDDNN